MCGQYVEQFVFKNNTIYELNPKECYKPQAYSVDISIPSGKMFFTSSIEDLEMDFDTTAAEYTALGKYQRSIEYSKHNIVCFSIGNSMPTLYQNSTTMVLGRKYDDELPLKNGIEIGHLDTTVWQVMVMDYANLIKEQLVNGFSLQNEYFFVVPVIGNLSIYQLLSNI
jgi:hypothetical protein